jgi:hypothetical protein
MPVKTGPIPYPLWNRVSQISLPELVSRVVSVIQDNNPRISSGMGPFNLCLSWINLIHLYARV